MNAKVEHIKFTLAPADNDRLAALCGPHDEHLRQIEEYTGVEVSNRGNDFRLVGEQQVAGRVERLIKHLYTNTARKEPLTSAGVHLALQQFQRGDDEKVEDTETQLRTPKLLVKGRTPRQRDYVRAIVSHDINFGVGPAGTGKTYLAVACAVEALQNHRVRRIVLVRPAVEAGERLGFLPGDLEQKVDPYLRPLYDALHDMLGFEKVARLMEKNIIELAPLAYMRGRTLNEAFIILDEAQNTTAEQMKMFLTRIGFGTTAVITGDITQIDLQQPSRSGLKQVIEILKDVKGVSFTHFQARDVVRHPLVQNIIEAYDRHQNKD
ncbi:MAG: PhoH family protein [Gammaproteobacteria bacterium]|nr:PhoH family protein [Gammaproteobacteria bacterium]